MDPTVPRSTAGVSRTTGGRTVRAWGVGLFVHAGIKAAAAAKARRAVARA
jgi:hypothetical protein